MALQNLLERNVDRINKVVREYEPSRRLTVLEGMRDTLPADAFPSFEVEATSGSNSWATTRGQRPRYEFQCTLTVKVSNPNFGHEYITTLATVISEIMTSPENLQMLVPNELHWTPYGDVEPTRILDSLVENITFNASRDGSIRTAEFSWFVMIHETYPETKWRVGESMTPSVLRPEVVPLL